MSTRLAAILVTVVTALIALGLSPVIWPRPAGGPAPDPSLLPFLIVIGLLEALVFGLGVAFIIFGRPIVGRASRIAGVAAWPVYLSIAWLLVSWWPHSNFHQVIGENFIGLIAIEYAFHVTIMIATILIARFFLAVIRAGATSRATSESAATSLIGRAPSL